MNKRAASNAALVLPAADPSSEHVQEIRGERVVLDKHLAAIVGVTTKVFNQAFKRNSRRFPSTWAFRLTEEEFSGLRSQIVTSNGGRGGRRTLPWAFTEHGVVMAASILRSERAISIMHMVVDVFVRARRPEVGLISANTRAIATTMGAFSQRVQRMIDRLLDAVVDQDDQRTVRDEANEVLQKSLDYIKAKLSKAEFENQALAAEATRLLSEAEANKATAARTYAVADALALQNLANKLRLVLEAEQAIAKGEMEGFLRVLGELGKPAVSSIQLTVDSLTPLRKP
jgi:ORF6N domain